MNTTKYDVETIARLSGLPACLVGYYALIGLLGGLEEPMVSVRPTGLELVDLEKFIQYATAARFSDKEIHCLLQLNEHAEEEALQLASAKMTELTQQQRTIARLQEHLETWIFEYGVNAESKTF